MSKQVNYEIIKDRIDVPLIIKDIGPWDEYLTLTNGAEIVIKELIDNGILQGRRLLYIDTENCLDELLIKDNEFNGFKTLTEEERQKWLRS